jgi:predicted nucleic acid-binding protein
VVVVSDTSPVHYLVLIGEVHVLHGLYGQLLLPQAVVRELAESGAPAKVREWMASPPSWVEIRKAPANVEASFPQLHAGESEAIALAAGLRADLLLMDDFDGRKHARKLGLHVVGTLGILDAGAERGLLDFPGALGLLLRTNFRLSPDLLQVVRDRESHRRRKRAGEEERGEENPTAGPGGV